MNAIPAKVAGVPRQMVTPPGIARRLIQQCWLRQEAGVEEIYRVGGAQAIAALAYGQKQSPKLM